MKRLAFIAQGSSDYDDRLRSLLEETGIEPHEFIGLDYFGLVPFFVLAGATVRPRRTPTATTSTSRASSSSWPTTCPRTASTGSCATCSTTPTATTSRSSVPAAPDPATVHPVTGQERVVFLRPLIESAGIEVGEYTYYDHPDDPRAFERDAVLYAFGPERLVIGRYCAIAAGVRFLMGGANHADQGPSTYPFGIFGAGWAETMDLVIGRPSRGDTVVGHDVWLGYERARPARRDHRPRRDRRGRERRQRRRAALRDRGRQPGPRRARGATSDEDVERLLRAAWWDWPVAAGHAPRADDHERDAGRARAHRRRPTRLMAGAGVAADRPPRRAPGADPRRRRGAGRGRRAGASAPPRPSSPAGGGDLVTIV